MAKKAAKNPADYIIPLYINGLEGRMLRLPAPKNKKREILFVYGSHSSIERWWGVTEELNKFGAVTMPDLPGFGGMTSLYKIGKKPTIDNLADYLASFVKLKYRNKKVTIMAMSLGFVVATRMLQRYPELTKKVDILISVVGFAHNQDFIFSKGRRSFYRSVSRAFSYKWSSALFRYTALQPVVLKTVYHRTQNAKEKFSEVSGDEFKRTMDMEIQLWHSNDIRTQFLNYLEMFSLDNTTKQVNLKVWHVAAKNDRYFDNVKVEEHMRRIFKDFKIFYTKSPTHAPTVIATAKEAAPFIPPEVRRGLNKK